MLNKVQFIGHLGRDPETRHMPNGTAVCNFSVASSERWKDKQGEQQERTEWLRCSAFDRLAEICGEYLRKGSLVYVEGSLQTRKYEDKDGTERYVTECRLREMKMLGGKPEREEAQKPAARPAPRAAAYGGGFDDTLDDDIPF